MELTPLDSAISALIGAGYECRYGTGPQSGRAMIRGGSYAAVWKTIPLAVRPRLRLKNYGGGILLLETV